MAFELWTGETSIIEMRTVLFYMDSDHLANNHNWGTYFGDAIYSKGIDGDAIDTQRNDGDAIDTQWIDRDTIDTQRIDGDAIDTQQIDGDAIDIQYTTDGVVINKRWSDLIDTQGIIRDAIVIPYSTNRHAIDIQYCLTEGKRLDDGQIHLQ